MEHDNVAELLELAIQQAGAKVAAIGDGQWSNETPCSEWNVRDLVTHMTDELLWIPPLLEGRDMDEAAERVEAETADTDLTTVWEHNAPEATAAVRNTDPKRAVEISSGTVPARQYMEEILVDITVHTWDLATGIEADTNLDSRLVEAVYALLKDKADEWRAAGVLGETVEVNPDADIQTKLLALAGRAV